MPPEKSRCSACREDVTVPDFTMAFQPIVDVRAGSVFAYEALVRPPAGGSAYDVLNQIGEDNRYAFDQACRVKAIELAAKLEMQSLLSINFLPNAVYQPAACLRKTFDAAERTGFPLHHLIFEVTENEPSRDVGHLQNIFNEYKRHGMITAIDDFGAGHSGLNMLADFQPDVLKIDMQLTRAVNQDPVRYEIAKSIVSLCARLHISVVAEGVETMAEAVTLVDIGVRLFQGYLFAKPAVECLPSVPDSIFETIRNRHDESLLNGSAATGSNKDVVPQLPLAGSNSPR